jgi:sortase A
VQALRVVDSDQESLSVDTSTDKKLLLVTCYPFDAILAGGPLRYVVTAVPT